MKVVFGYMMIMWTVHIKEPLTPWNTIRAIIPILCYTTKAIDSISYVKCVCHVAVSLRPAGQQERVSGNDALRSLGVKLKHVQQARLVLALICQWKPAYQICCAYIYLSDFRAFFFFYCRLSEPLPETLW